MEKKHHQFFNLVEKMFSFHEFKNEQVEHYSEESVILSPKSSPKNHNPLVQQHRTTGWLQSKIETKYL